MKMNKTRIDIRGIIIPNDEKWIYDWFEIDSTCPRDVTDVLQRADGGQVDVYITSDGGEIFAGSEIFEALRQYEGIVKIHVVGLAASAASVILCAGESDIAPTGMVMKHNVQGGARGDYHVMDHSSEMLQKANKAMAAAYRYKTGKSEEEILAAMDKETWMTAEEAVAFGLVDRIAEKPLRLAASRTCGMLPPEVIEKMRNQKMNPQQMEAGFSTPDAEVMQAKLKLLSMRRIV